MALFGNQNSADRCAVASAILHRECKEKIVAVFNSIKADIFNYGNATVEKKLMDALFIIIGSNAESIGEKSLYAASGKIFSGLFAEETVSTGAESKTLAAGKVTLDVA